MKIGKNVLAACLVGILVILGLLLSKGNRDSNSIIQEHALNQEHRQFEEKSKTLTVKHAFSSGIHYFSGTFTLPDNCHSFDISTTTTSISFLKKEPEPGQQCDSNIIKKDYIIEIANTSASTSFTFFLDSATTSVRIIDSEISEILQTNIQRE